VDPQLESPAYKFTGFKILNIKGTAKEGGTTYDVKGPEIAATTGVFNYPTGPTLPNPPSIPGNPGNPGPIVDADSIPHSLPDQLFNPKGLGLGFDPTGFDYGDPAAFISFPADALDNYFSFGGITFTSDILPLQEIIQQRLLLKSHTSYSLFLMTAPLLQPMNLSKLETTPVVLGAAKVQ
jgi:hypothetical protein